MVVKNIIHIYALRTRRVNRIHGKNTLVRNALLFLSLTSYMSSDLFNISVHNSNINQHAHTPPLSSSTHTKRYIAHVGLLDDGKHCILDIWV